MTTLDMMLNQLADKAESDRVNSVKSKASAFAGAYIALKKLFSHTGAEAFYECEPGILKSKQGYGHELWRVRNLRSWREYNECNDYVVYVSWNGRFSVHTGKTAWPHSYFIKFRIDRRKTNKRGGF